MQLKSSEYLNGYDWVRAFVSVSVVTWHLHSFGTSLLYTEKYARFKFNLLDVTNFQIVPLAVPLFVVIACYLLARSQTDWPRLRHRLWRLLMLTVFWTVALAVWKDSWTGLQKMAPDSPRDLAITVLSANGEFYYFFLVLGLSLFATYLFNKLSTRWNVIGAVLTIAATFYLPQIAIDAKQPILVTYWSPLNVLPYPFLGILIHRYQDRILASWRSLLAVVAISFGLAFLFAWYEWTHYVQGIFLAEGGLAYPLLMRVSLAFETIALAALTLLPWGKAPAVIRFMAKHSLALFVFHAFFKPVVTPVIGSFGLSEWVGRLSLLAGVILCSYLASLVAVVFVKEDLIR